MYRKSCKLARLVQTRDGDNDAAMRSAGFNVTVAPKFQLHGKKRPSNDGALLSFPHRLCRTDWIDEPISSTSLWDVFYAYSHTSFHVWSIACPRLAYLLLICRGGQGQTQAGRIDWSVRHRRARSFRLFSAAPIFLSCQLRATREKAQLWDYCVNGRLLRCKRNDWWRAKLDRNTWNWLAFFSSPLRSLFPPLTNNQ